MPPRVVKNREDSIITNIQQSVQQKVFPGNTKKLRPNSYQPPPLNTPFITRKPQAPF